MAAIVDQDATNGLVARFLSMPDSQRLSLLAQLLPRLTLPELKYTHNFASDNRPRSNMTLMLPDELMLLVCEWLPPPSLSAFARTCHRFATLIRDNHLWRRILHQSPGAASPRKPSSSKTNPASGPAHPQLQLDKTRQVHGIAKTVSLAPWKSLYKQRWLTMRNWKTGRCTVSRVSSQPGNLHPEFDVDTAVVASISRNEPGQLWNYTNGQVLARLVGHEGTITAIKFHGDYVITGSADRTLKLWNVVTGECLRTYSQGHTQEIVAIDCFENDLLVSGGEDGVIAVWQLSTGQLLGQLRDHTGAVLAVQCEHATRTLVSASADHTLKRWSLDGDQHRCLVTLAGHTAEVFCLALHPNYVVSGSGDCTIKLWSMQDHRCVRTLEGHLGPVICLQVDHDKIVSGGIDKNIKVWDLHTSQPLYTIKQHSGAVQTVRFNQHKLISSAFDNTLLVCDFEAPRANDDDDDC
ncbi:hypothetical protein RI367_003249 [Sorochytrium milnesiophthora]